MKASAFGYTRPTSVVNALDLLVAHGDKAKVMSGGQSLMPALNLRLLSPEMIVDIGALSELRGIDVSGDRLTIGALTRHVELLNSVAVAAHAPLLKQAIAHVAHPAIRNRGTLGGNLAQADPASELPACMVALDATIMVRSRAGERRIAAAAFFKGIYETELSSDELLVAVELPLAPCNAAFFFDEFARRRGDYAITGLAAFAKPRGDRFTDLRLAFFAVGDRPILVGAARRLIDVPITTAVLSDALNALDQELDPPDDQQASAAMRRHLARVLLTRCVRTLLGRHNIDAGKST